jgi:hypothetical protein
VARTEGTGATTGSLSSLAASADDAGRRQAECDLGGQAIASPMREDPVGRTLAGRPKENRNCRERQLEAGRHDRQRIGQKNRNHGQRQHPLGGQLPPQQAGTDDQQRHDHCPLRGNRETRYARVGGRRAERDQCRTVPQVAPATEWRDQYPAHQPCAAGRKPDVQSGDRHQVAGAGIRIALPLLCGDEMAGTDDQRNHDSRELTFR